MSVISHWNHTIWRLNSLSAFQVVGSRPDGLEAVSFHCAGLNSLSAFQVVGSNRTRKLKQE